DSVAVVAAVARPLAVGLGDLSKLCACQVLLHLDPPGNCWIVRLNHAFRVTVVPQYIIEQNTSLRLPITPQTLRQTRSCQRKAFSSCLIYLQTRVASP
ncbi:unnamed protein product, partial [Urochloa humidicola]